MEPIIPTDRKVEVLLADMPLWLARDYDSDHGLFWVETMPAVCRAYMYTPDEYWDLTVDTHARLYSHLGVG
jgi:hypothetical protein